MDTWTCPTCHTVAWGTLGFVAVIREAHEKAHR